MITIDEVEYAEEDLNEEAKARVERIQELQAAMSHHAAKIKEALDVSVQLDKAND